MPDNLPQQVDVQLPPETSSVVVAKVVYGLHALSIIIGVVTGGSILGAFLFGWPSMVCTKFSITQPYTDQTSDTTGLLQSRLQRLFLLLPGSLQLFLLPVLLYTGWKHKLPDHHN